MSSFELCHNSTHKWPSWVNSSLWESIVKVYDDSSRLSFHTDVLRRLRGGIIKNYHASYLLIDYRSSRTRNSRSIYTEKRGTERDEEDEDVCLLSCECQFLYTHS